MTRKVHPAIGVWAVLSMALAALLGVSRRAEAQADDPTPPRKTVKLLFIHHSCGENWLADENGGLAKALAKNNYFVSDTNYEWGPSAIGDRTDITDWPEWFTGPKSATCLKALFSESGTHSPYERDLADPGGKNQVVVFKSCFPNSELEGAPGDRPQRGDGLTVANAKAIYDELLVAFSKAPDTLFIAVTAPPVQNREHAANARAFNNWLVHDWLAGYQGANVGVFDFYNVLTSPDAHHRFRGGKREHVVQPGRNTLHYPSDDDHPSRAGNQKATAEFVPLLNVYYHGWLAGSRDGAGPSHAPAPAAPK